MKRRRLAALALIACTAVCALGCAATRSSAARSAVDFVNAQLGPAWAAWLVGPISRLSTRDEIHAYLALANDADAERFVEAFWAKRNPNPASPRNHLRDAFEKRANEADRLFFESGVRGSHTDRGTILVLYGPPKEIDHEMAVRSDEPPIEVWTYDAKAAHGLDGRSPLPRYRFVRRGDLTVFTETTVVVGPPGEI